MTESLRSGSAVRYEQTAARWFLAVVRQVLGDSAVELEYLDGRREQVDAAKVTPLIPYLKSRGRTLSLKREALCYALYAKNFTRLRQDRIDAMQNFLRTHAVRFSPKEWGLGVRIQLRADDSVVAPEKSARDLEFESLLPRWLAPHRLPPGSRDPLGFQNFAERLANEFLPGLTVFTTRIGYYGFLAWAIQTLNEGELKPGSPPRKELFHRLERALALCEFVHHGPENNDCRLIGQRSKSEVLQSAVEGRFGVPAKIMKNQESGGAFRLYATSLDGNGFVSAAPELGASGLLPFTLTDLGRQLGRAFGQHVPEDFFAFATQGKRLDRDVLRNFGAQLCFSNFGNLARYRSPFLQGFLLGGSGQAEIRYRTVQLLFASGLLASGIPAPGATADSVTEEDAASIEDAADGGALDNVTTLLHFYDQPPSQAICVIQRAAVFELLSVAQSAIFRQALTALDQVGRTSIDGLLTAILASPQAGKAWRTPLGSGHDVLPDVQSSLAELFADNVSPADVAATAGAILARVMIDPAFAACSADLVGTPVMTLLETTPHGSRLTDVYPQLIEAMVVRHEQVSLAKNRQRWLYQEGGELVKDELRPMMFGWHAMRFPQVAALCADLRLQQEDLSDAQ